ncbi:MAG: hypothetical protein KDD60_02220, partial [Bdellovibrionales bacterium]|nr:hypothetical protein [Bdellovibrionales bacterium]
TSITFPTNGTRTKLIIADIFITDIPWNNGSTLTQDIDVYFYPFTQLAGSSAISDVTVSTSSVAP